MIKKRSNILLITCVISMLIMSIITIYSASFSLGSNYSNLYLKQTFSILFSILIIFIITLIGNKRLFKYAYFFYILSVFLLFLTLFFGTNINGATCWLKIGPLTFQPSEFMKISLILVIAKITEEYHYNNKFNFKEEFKYLTKVFILTFIPSLLTFLEPDTGSVIIYILISISIVFISPVRKRWFVFLISIIILLLALLINLYINYQDIFINIFGTNIFYRIDRIMNWQLNTGMQLENSLIAISNGNITGLGLTNTSIYIPEAYSDFIFSILTNNFGLLGALYIIFIIIIFDLEIINNINFNSTTIEKYTLIGILTTIVYSQIQNISMTIGLLPIIGIPLPFISYGGSSLMTYMIFLAIILNTKRKKSIYLSN